MCSAELLVWRDSEETVVVPGGTRIGAHLARTGQRARERGNELLVRRDPKEPTVTHLALVPATTQA